MRLLEWLVTSKGTGHLFPRNPRILREPESTSGPLRAQTGYSNQNREYEQHGMPLHLWLSRLYRHDSQELESSLR